MADRCIVRCCFPLCFILQMEIILYGRVWIIYFTCLIFRYKMYAQFPIRGIVCPVNRVCTVISSIVLGNRPIHILHRCFFRTFCIAVDFILIITNFGSIVEDFFVWAESTISCISCCLDHPNCRTAWIYHLRSSSVPHRSRITTFCVQPIFAASDSRSGLLW